MTTLGLTALALVAVQLLVTLAFQFRPLSTRFATLDLLGIVPRWKFFVLEHGRYDLAVECRGRRVDGNLTDWRIVWSPAPRSRWGWLWQPNAVRDAATWLAVTILDERVASGRPACPETSAAYATVVDLCRRAAGDEGWEDGQFALIRVTPGGERRTRYTSTFHIF